MADFTKAFRLLLDADTKGAVSGLTGFESAAKKAETTTATTSRGISGSFGNIIAKTGLGQKAMQTFGISAGTMGTVAMGAVGAAGGAIAKFALDGATKFADLGLAVQKFQTIAGTSAEEASRWIAVADDYGVSADTISTAVGRLGKALGTNETILDQYGIATVRGKDGNLDLSATTFNVIDAYNKMQDPAKKAKLATDAFGKGYQDLIPLITQGSETIKTSFKGVAESQIMNDEDTKRAQDYKLAMDDLKDSVTDLQMAIGKQLIPVIVELGTTATNVVGPINDVLDALPSGALGKGVAEIVKSFFQLTNPIALSAIATDRLGEQLGRVTEKAPLLVSMFDDMKTAVMKVTPELDKIPPPLDAIGQHFVDWKANQDALGNDIAWIAKSRENYDALGADILEIVADQQAAIVGTDEYEKRTSQMKDAVEADLASIELKWQELTGTITGDQAFLNLQGQFDDVKTKGVEALAAVQSGAADAEQKARDSALAYDDLKLKVVDYGKEVLGLPVEKVTTLLTEIKKGELQRVEEQLEILTRNRTVNLEIIAKGGAGYGVGRRQAGGPVGPGFFGTVGEAGTEVLAIDPFGRGYVYPHGSPVTRAAMAAVGMRRMALGGVIGTSPYVDVLATARDYLAGRGSVSDRLAMSGGTVFGRYVAGRGTVAARRDQYLAQRPMGGPTVVDPRDQARILRELGEHQFWENTKQENWQRQRMEDARQRLEYNWQRHRMEENWQRQRMQESPRLYQITVNVPPIVDRAAIGKVIAESLKAYEGVSGRGWRN